MWETSFSMWKASGLPLSVLVSAPSPKAVIGRTRGKAVIIVIVSKSSYIRLPPQGSPLARKRSPRGSAISAARRTKVRPPSLLLRLQIIARGLSLSLVYYTPSH